ncbi:CASP-like protein XL3 [Chenopodium quinoa]|uniref:CASP-like protein XL3 n=1 Tax=Chenopodium quinoa TaxID=63459 RepID=UPI000B79785E|nr:CASP-like protein XL3 [Chenopodium quinoa]
MEFIQINRMMKVEAILRLFALSTLLMAAIIMITDVQTKVYFGVLKMKVSYKLTVILKVSLYTYFIGAGYNLLQLVRCLAFTDNNAGDKLSLSNHVLKWSYFLLDQVVAYVVFAIMCASTQIAFLALFGSHDLEWMKLCSKYVRFCVQIGGSIACGGVASILLAAISGISTFNLFRWYSPNFLCLKPKKIGIVAPPSTR